MTGATLPITVEFDDTEVRKTLQGMIDAALDLQPAFREIGELLDLQHRLRWDKGVSPDGTPWEPLSASTLESKRRRNRPDDILVDSGDLRDTLRWQASNTQLLFGTDRVYGAVHQFGRGPISSISTGQTLPSIPARPWLGIAAEDKLAILDILADHIITQKST